MHVIRLFCFVVGIGMVFAIVEEIQILSEELKGVSKAEGETTSSNLGGDVSDGKKIKRVMKGF